MNPEKRSNHRWIRVGAAVFLLLAAAAYYGIRSRTKLPPDLDASSQRAASETTARFDHSTFDALLKKYVRDARVNYRAWKGDARDLAALDEYLGRIATADLSALSREERLAFFINAYNAVTIRSVLDAYPVASIRDIVGVWKARTWRVAGGEVTLDQIEHAILRPRFGDPRVHFAIVCASIGCPPIQSEAFDGGEIDTRLNRVAAAFLNDTGRTRIDAANRRMTLTPIFKWFEADFTDSAGDVPSFVLGFRPDVAAGGSKWSVDYDDYDWSLNE